MSLVESVAKFAGTVGLGSALTALLGYLFRNLLVARLAEAMKTQFAKEIEGVRAQHAKGLEDYRAAIKHQEEARHTATKTAQLIVHWARESYKDDAALASLQAAYWEWWLLVPEDLARSAVGLFAQGHSPQALLVEARKFIHGSSTLTADELVTFRPRSGGLDASNTDEV